LSAFYYSREYGPDGQILTGDGVYTVRLRATQGIPDLHQ
jgi:hypothetical protein